MVVNALLGPEDKVVIQPPVYHPFRLVPQKNGHEIVYNPLILREDGGYDMDFENLEQVLQDPACRLLILSNPHNPAGIVWPHEILQQLAAICHRHHVIVISDEIHCDMALFGHKHIPFATVSPEAAAISITFGAPSKTFNIAGIVSSYAVVPDPHLRERFFNWLEANEFGAPDIFAPIATVAAYTQGEPWRRELISYLEENVRFVESFLAKQIPEIRPLRPQASFLVWLDCRGLGLDHDALVDLFVGRAGLALNDGDIFGAPGWMRLNIGAPRAVLEEALNRLRDAIRQQ
jgi:cystathionine beta-lyase